MVSVGRRRRAMAIAALGLGAASCQALLGIDPNVNVLDDADGEVDAPANADREDLADVRDARVDAGPFVCPEAGGSAQVQVGTASYCIDRTEVTVGDYRAFLAARAGDTSGQRADCTGNESFVPTVPIPPVAKDAYPVQFVDFCDAVGFCEWAGKRLCGAIDGGSLDLANVNDAHESQWFRACSKNADGLHQFPYGSPFDPTKCNTYLDGGDTPRFLKPVGSYPQCEGGYDGIFDMAGNLAELEDACGLVDGSVQCAVRGGSFNNGFANSSACAQIAYQIIDGAAPTTGFRCCSR